MSKLHQLAQLGQAIWLDYIERSFLTTGKLQELIELGLRGMTSNPTIFEKAIIGRRSPELNQTGDYDLSIQQLIQSGKSVQEIYETLAIEDVQLAADLFYPVYLATDGADGYVSLEVNPALANDTQTTLMEARRLWDQVNRPNLMIKIPATPAGLPAITQAIAEGINVNVTLIFSLKRYQEVIEAYLQGLEHRVREGKPLDQIASVASFFVSRVDTKVDKRLRAIIQEEGVLAALATSLLGKSAVANAKIAYSIFRQVFEGERFRRLQAKGARKQRPLWASTSTKNPSYSDILYVQELIGADTVNTLPPNTLEAFLDHGEVRLTLEEDLEKAHSALAALEELGISMEQVTFELEEEGVKAFAQSFESLINSIESKRHEFLPTKGLLTHHLGTYQTMVNTALKEIATKDIVSRIWREDYTVWKPYPEEIANRLGWLYTIDEIYDRLPQIEAFVYAVRQAGYTRAVLLGMGGSSLAPELFSKVLSPSQASPPIGLSLDILDTTVPETILEYSESLDPTRTLFIVSTKSGTTEETLSLFKYFYNWTLDGLGNNRCGDHFIAITDPGSNLADLADQYHFRATFLNDPNIGGRYSALSYFGLIPAALAGVDIGRLLSNAKEQAQLCQPSVPASQNPAAQLGVILGELAKAGRDKVTFLLPYPIAAFGDWIEQLLAESTGKEKKGILPVVGEPISSLESYGGDRLFISYQLSENDPHLPTLSSLETAGHPTIRFRLKDLYELGAQIFLWEMATAIAGHCLGINPFDQPDVEASKTLAREMISKFKDRGRLPPLAPSLISEDLEIYGLIEASTPDEALYKFLSTAQPDGYIAIQAFLPPNETTTNALRALRSRLLQVTHLATTIGYGPRFLHSTGQLHKGDAGKGLFIQFTAENQRDVPIPDKAGSFASSLTFGTLLMAQALGDFHALQNAGRNVLRIHLKSRPDTIIYNLVKALK